LKPRILRGFKTLPPHGPAFAVAVICIVHNQHESTISLQKCGTYLRSDPSIVHNTHKQSIALQ